MTARPEPRPPAVVRVRALVTGRVQGVWYRESCRREAELLGVTGWVRNRPDGRVEIEAEGPRPAVDELLAWARQGPPLARVETLALEDLAPVGAGAGRFRVG
jgi:acylphosphatase